MRNLLILISILLAPLTVRAIDAFTGDKTDFHGASLRTVMIGGAKASVLCPKQPAAGKPWVLAGSLYNLDSPPVANMTRTELELVKRGFHVVAFGLGNTFGAPDAIAKWDPVYDEMTNKYGLSKHVALLGVSREGLPITRWAAAHSGRVSCLYMDKAVCDFKSWPGGKLGFGKGSPRDWESLIPLYHFKSEAEALAYHENPVDLAPKLAADKVAIIYLAGETDDAVPYTENGARMEQVYHKAGGIFQLILQKGEGHHPHGLSDPSPVVDFIQRHAGAGVTRNTRFIPDFRIKPDDYSVLMAADGTNPNGLRAWINDHRRLQVKDWPLGGQTTWEVEVVEEGDYAVNVLFNHSIKMPLKVAVKANAAHCEETSEYIAHHDWRRLPLSGTLHLAKGRQQLALTVAPTSGPPADKIELLSIELVRPEVKERLHRAAMAMRDQADTPWFRSARYGLMCHWTSRTVPRNGPPKSYAYAVRDFDVKTFAEQVAKTGAHFVTITTSHAQMYFPAPLKSLDRILPGRTSQRDLIGDLVVALGKHDIRLILYYHLGSNDDTEWQHASGFGNTDTTKFWNNWTAVISEVGERYGDQLAGWWFDDGTANYYYRSAQWERLATAAKAGNAKRLICFNPWILPSATEFQDYHAGEGSTDPTVQGWLKPDDHGRISGGAYAGLQASAALVMEGDWLHTKRDTEISKPRYTAEQTADLLKRYSALGNVLMLNLEIYQDGTLSPMTVQMLNEAQRLEK